MLDPGVCALLEEQVQRRALLAVGNLAFCLENRRQLIASESLRELLLRLSGGPDGRICKAAGRVLAILGMQNMHHLMMSCCVVAHH